MFTLKKTKGVCNYNNIYILLRLLISIRYHNQINHKNISYLYTNVIHNHLRLTI